MAEDDILTVDEPVWELTGEMTTRAEKQAAAMGIPIDVYMAMIQRSADDIQAMAEDAAAETWVPLGPRNVGGAVRCLAQHPRNPEILYAGSAMAGVWKSEDSGATWSPSGQQSGIAQPIGSIALCPGDPDFLLAGSGELPSNYYTGTGLYASRDAGTSFTRIRNAASVPDPAGLLPGEDDRYHALRFDSRLDTVAGPGNVTTVGTTLNGAGFSGSLAVGDVIRIGDERRLVVAVTSDTQATLDEAFAIDVSPAATWSRIGHRSWIAGDRGLYRFEPGGGFVTLKTGQFTDVIVARDPVQASRVVVIAAQSGTGLFRGELDDTEAIAGPGTLTSTAGQPTITVNGATLAAGFLEPGDLVVVSGQTRIVASIQDDHTFTVATPFDPALNAAAGWQRRLHTTWTALTLYMPTLEGTAPNQRVVAGAALGAGTFGRIRLAISRFNTSGAADPSHVYAILEDRGAELPGGGSRHPTRVHRSVDFGRTWAPSGNRPYTPPASDGIAWYALAIEVHPRNPTLLVAGSMDIYRSADAGDTWQMVLDWQNFDRGDRGQHADQHALMFDNAEPDRLWVGNDGGVAFHEGFAAASTWRGWRKASYGIIAGQFYDFSNHPRWPFILAGGLQDNGAYLSFGGPTWYCVGVWDGGAVAFEPDDARFIYTSSNSWVHTALLTTVGPTIPPGGSTVTRNTTRVPFVPELRSRVPEASFLSHLNLLTSTNMFTGVNEHHPTLANHMLIGTTLALEVTTDGLTTTPLAVTGGDVHAVAYVPGRELTEWWAGMSQGRVWRFPNGSVGAPVNVTPPWTGRGATDAAGASCGFPPVAKFALIVTNAPNAGDYRIAVAGSTERSQLADTIASAGDRVDRTGTTDLTTVFQPGDIILGAAPGNNFSARIVRSVQPAFLITTLPFDPPLPAGSIVQKIGGGEIFLSDNQGANWTRISQGLPRGVIASLAFDPTDPRALYVGTFSGVCVARDLPAAPVGAGVASVTPTWTTYNRGLPKVLVNDLEVTRGTRLLRCATFGRGIFEANIGATAAADRITPVRLLIRNHVFEDGRSHADEPADDPRVPLVWGKLRKAPGTGTVSSAGTTVTCSTTGFSPPSGPPFFVPGDVIYAANQLQTVQSVTAQTLETDAAFNPALPGGTAYHKVVSEEGRGLISSNGTQVTGFATAFLTPRAVPFIRPGDLLVAAGELIEVRAVDSDFELTLARPFSADVLGMPYRRISAKRHFGRLSSTAASTTLSGRNTYFSQAPDTLAAGDLILARGQIREVQAVANDNQLTTTVAFDPPIDTVGLAPIGYTESMDIRVDAPGYQRFKPHTLGEALDGVEFDEVLEHDPPVPGDVNYVYVQVHNRGSSIALDSVLDLFFAPVDTDPPVIPDLWAGIPADPPAASPWKRAAPSRDILAIPPWKPHVEVIDWTPPLALQSRVALLAVCTNATDTAALSTAVVAADFVREERRASLRLTPVKNNPVYIRDTVGDAGQAGENAWGARSPDIVVRQSQEPAPDTAFADLTDPRLADRVAAGTNYVYVRVHNRTAEALSVDVALYQVPSDNPGDTSRWQQIGATVSAADVPTKGWKFAPELSWPVTAPEAGAPRGFVLVALLTPAGFPPISPPFFLTDPSSFWRDVRSSRDGDRVGVRALRFQA